MLRERSEAKKKSPPYISLLISSWKSSIKTGDMFQPPHSSLVQNMFFGGDATWSTVCQDEEGENSHSEKASTS